jgi:tetratricopeptide (TPR) repeat protein
MVDLVNGKDNTLLWSRRYTRKVTDIFALEQDIARQVAEGLRLRLTGEERERLAQSGTRNLEAYRAFLTGEYQTGGWRKSIPYYHRAIELDPSYQEAYHRLGVVHFQIARTETSENDYSLAKEFFEKVIVLDDTTPLARYCKAWILWSYKHNWDGAKEEYKRIEELGSPVLDEGLWNEGYLQFLEWMGLREEFQALTEENLRRSDPLSSFQQGAIGYQFLHHREYDRAIEQAHKLIALEPEIGDGYYLLNESYYKKGMVEEAFEAFLSQQKFGGASEEHLEAMRKVFKKSGIAGVWRLQLQDDSNQPTIRPISQASLLAKIGEKDRAFEWLEKTWNYPLMGYEVAPSSQNHDPLRDDPRFEKLLRKLNLPEEAIARHLAGYN